MTSRLAAVLDGTLIDSEPSWIAQQFALAGRHGGAWKSEQGLALVGADMHDTAVAMQAAGVEMEATALVAALERAVIGSLRVEVPWRPGVRELLAELVREAIPRAITTTFSRGMPALVASAAPEGAISVVVGSEGRADQAVAGALPQGRRDHYRRAPTTRRTVEDVLHSVSNTVADSRWAV
jgi:beta-phosphoglucomutase-like phosphatase (HAD superfamily)